MEEEVEPASHDLRILYHKIRYWTHMYKFYDIDDILRPRRKAVCFFFRYLPCVPACKTDKFHPRLPFMTFTLSCIVILPLLLLPLVMKIIITVILKKKRTKIEDDNASG